MLKKPKHKGESIEKCNEVEGIELDAKGIYPLIGICISVSTPVPSSLFRIIKVCESP